MSCGKPHRDDARESLRGCAHNQQQVRAYAPDSLIAPDSMNGTSEHRLRTEPAVKSVRSPLFRRMALRGMACIYAPYHTRLHGRALRACKRYHMPTYAEPVRSTPLGLVVLCTE